MEQKNLRTSRTFSVGLQDTKNREVVDRIDKHIKRTGQTFSYIILAALTKYEKEVINKEYYNG
jgi:hypothetical protein